MTKNTETPIQSSSSKELVSDVKSSMPTPLRSPAPSDPPEDNRFNPPLPICRKCNKPVHWMRIQPDMTRGELKVTVGCGPHGKVHEATDTYYITLQQLENATHIEPGYAFT